SRIGRERSAAWLKHEPAKLFLDRTALGILTRAQPGRYPLEPAGRGLEFLNRLQRIHAQILIEERRWIYGAELRRLRHAHSERGTGSVHQVVIGAARGRKMDDEINSVTLNQW